MEYLQRVEVTFSPSLARLLDGSNWADGSGQCGKSVLEETSRGHTVRTHSHVSFLASGPPLGTEPIWTLSAAVFGQFTHPAKYYMLARSYSGPIQVLNTTSSEVTCYHVGNHSFLANISLVTHSSLSWTPRGALMDQQPRYCDPLPLRQCISTSLTPFYFSPPPRPNLNSAWCVFWLDLKHLNMDFQRVWCWINCILVLGECRLPGSYRY